MSVNRVLLEARHINSFSYYLEKLLKAHNERIPSCSRDHMAYNVENIYSLALYIKSLPALGLDQPPYMGCQEATFQKSVGGKNSLILRIRIFHHILLVKTS